MAHVLTFLVQESTSHCRVVTGAPGAPSRCPSTCLEGVLGNVRVDGCGGAVFPATQGPSGCPLILQVQVWIRLWFLLGRLSLQDRGSEK